MTLDYDVKRDDFAMGPSRRRATLLLVNSLVLGVRGAKRGVFKMEGSGIITWEDNIN